MYRHICSPLGWWILKNVLSVSEFINILKVHEQESNTSFIWWLSPRIFLGDGGGSYICFVGNWVLNIFLYDNNTAIYDYDALRLSKWNQFDMQRIWLRCYCYIYCLYIKYNWTQQPKPNSIAFLSFIWKVIISFKNTSILHFDNISLAPDF